MWTTTAAAAAAATAVVQEAALATEPTATIKPELCMPAARIAKSTAEQQWQAASNNHDR